MIEITEQFILALEHCLGDAIVQSDVTVLDELLAPLMARACIDINWTELMSAVLPGAKNNNVVIFTSV